MKEKPIVYSFGVLFAAHVSFAYYFHEPSFVEFITSGDDDKADFGHSIAYQRSTSKLFVSAPHSGMNGNVYSCLTTDLNKKSIECDNVGIDIDTLAGDYSRSLSPEQNFCLGASISVTDNYIFTCAPLWSSNFTDGDTDNFGPLGTCFWSNGTYAERYFGLTEQYLDKELKEKPHIYDILGGVGWNTFADPENKVIIIAMSQTESSISYIKMDQPSEPAKLIYSSSRKSEEPLNNYNYLGLGMTSGVFFSDHLTLLYAFSMISQTQISGAIGFFYYDTEDEKMKILSHARKSILIMDQESNSMYGSVLHSADLNLDDFHEILVGAPAHTSSIGYEQGAVHFYLGGKKKVEKQFRPSFTVQGTKIGARFGSAIATADLDGDSRPEIFVSAPYEDTGVVYILAGHEIVSYFNWTGLSKVPLSSLKFVQRIQNSNSEAFGISLQFVDQGDEKALAIGSPNKGKVFLYRSVPFINVTVTASLKGIDTVRELDKNFTMIVTMNVSFSTKPELISGVLLLTVEIEGEGAHINVCDYSFVLNKNTTVYRTDVFVDLLDEEPRDYNFKVKVKSDEKNFNRKDFDRTLYTISKNYGNQEISVPVVRRCKEAECIPKLSLNFTWSGSDKEYILGSSPTESMVLAVKNDGNATYTSCAKVKITGAQFTIPLCVPVKEDWYRCDLLKIERHDIFAINVEFNMTQNTNLEEVLVVEAELYNNCANSGTPNFKANKTVSIILPTSNISINGLGYSRNVTKSEIENDDFQFIEIRKSYTATNNGTYTWKSITAEIVISKEPFIEDAKISQSVFGCIKSKNEEQDIIFTCTIDVIANSTTTIQTAIKIIKRNLMDYFEDDKTSVTSDYILYLSPTEETRKKSFVATISLQEDTSFGNNQNLIILLSVLISFFILAISTFVLCKIGFFKSKEKTKLNALKEEIRKKSICRPASAHEEDFNVELDDEYQIELEVIENAIPRPEGNASCFKDSDVLIVKDENR